jgi:hypothetical protein
MIESCISLYVMIFLDNCSLKDEVRNEEEEEKEKEK